MEIKDATVDFLRFTIQTFGSYCQKERKLQPIADRVEQNLEIISKKFNLVPRIPGFSWGLSLVPSYCVVKIIIPWADFWYVGFFRKNVIHICIFMDGCKHIYMKHIYTHVYPTYES